MSEQPDELRPPDAGAGPPDEVPAAPQAPGFEEAENLAPDPGLADPAVQASA